MQSVILLTAMLFTITYGQVRLESIEAHFTYPFGKLKEFHRPSNSVDSFGVYRFTSGPRFRVSTGIQFFKMGNFYLGGMIGLSAMNDFNRLIENRKGAATIPIGSFEYVDLEYHRYYERTKFTVFGIGGHVGLYVNWNVKRHTLRAFIIAEDVMEHNVHRRYGYNGEELRFSSWTRTGFAGRGYDLGLAYNHRFGRWAPSIQLMLSEFPDHSFLRKFSKRAYLGCAFYLNKD